MAEQRVIKGVAHYVYEDLDEFKKTHPNTVVHPDWRKANEGDWVYSDDNRIVQLLKVSNEVKHHSDRKNYKFAKGWVRTVVGSFLNRKNVKLKKIVGLANKNNIKLIEVAFEKSNLSDEQSQSDAIIHGFNNGTIEVDDAEEVNTCCRPYAESVTEIHELGYSPGLWPKAC